MNKTEVQTIGRGTDTALVAVAAIVGLAGVVGFSFWADQSLWVRTGILLGGLGLGGLLAWFTGPGKRFVAFAQEAVEETRKVTWPDGKDSLKATGIVFAFVAVMGFALFLIDQGIEYGLYDLILGWKR